LTWLLAAAPFAPVDQEYLFEARQMQALSFAVHIPLVCFGIAFPAFVLFVEALWLRTGDPVYRTIAKRWSKVMLALFAVGVVTGTILSFELGLLWPNFMATFGDVFGLGFTLEAFSFFVEAIFIAIGIISLLTFLLMRQQATAGTDAALGEAFVAVYDRAFLVGPGFFAGLANGVVLGYLMYRSGLVPRGMAMLGLIGGPLVMASGIAVMFDVIERGSTLQGIATIPEFFWELSLGIYCIVKGFRPSSPILAMDRTVTIPESPSAEREGV